MFRSLYAKLALVLFLLFCLTGSALIIASLYSARLYQQEISQHLNIDLAPHIVDEYLLMEKGDINQKNLENLFHELMIINPSVELYLLDATGNILAFSASPKKIRRKKVSLQPLLALLNNRTQLPLMGDDPRSIDRKKVFSVAPIAGENNSRQGYIYAILGGEQVEQLSQMLQNSRILRWASSFLIAGLLFSLIAALVIFFLLTRRLRRLSTSMQAFKPSEHREAATHSHKPRQQPDEIDQLNITFAAMTDRIHSQMTQLQKTDSLRRELIANVSHDLRTPLASLRGYIETLEIKNETLSSTDRQEYLGIAKRHADILNRRIDDLFELAKLDARELKPRLEHFSISELIHDVSQKFELHCQQQGLSLRIAMNTTNTFAEADIALIERVLDNLIENAMRNTPAGGEICLQLDENEAHEITVSVIDTGCGIPAEDIPYIFDRFYQKSSGSSSDDKGTGLGLAIAQRIVDLHGSHLQVSSQLQQGSSFSFNLQSATNG